MPMLEICDIHTYYGNIHALKGISLTVERGEIVTLIGANGAGKTTTLQTISGLQKPRQGSILLDGEDLSSIEASPDRLQGCGHGARRTRYLRTVDRPRNLDLGAYSRTDTKAIAADQERVFTTFPRLKERQKQVAGTLSGGEQQMLAMGRALMAHPRMLLLDEPSMGLSPILVETDFRYHSNRLIRKAPLFCLWSRTHSWHSRSPTGAM